MRVQDTTLRGRVSAAGKELRDDESGAMMVIGLFFALFLVGALYYLLGIGQAAMYRERLQDAADTAAFAGAVFKARAMNFIALINMIMALLLAILIVIYSIYLMLMALTIVFQIMCGIPWTAAFGCPASAVTRAGANWVKQLYDRVKDPINNLIKLGSKAGEAISIGAPYVAPVLSFSRVTGTYSPPASFGVSLAAPNPVQRLPTRKAPYKELCDKALEYANIPWDMIRDLIPGVTFIASKIGSMFNSLAAAIVCGGSTSAPDITGAIREIGAEHGVEDGAPGYIIPRNTDQVECYQNGTRDACDRFAQWQKESSWDRTQGICIDVVSDPVTFTAHLPDGAIAATCRDRINAATNAPGACMTRTGTNGPRFGYRYTLQEMSRYVEVDADGNVSRQAVPGVRSLSVYPSGRGLDNPLCGEGGSWTTSTDVNRCIRPGSLTVEPEGDRALIGPLPNNPSAALTLIEEVLRANPRPARRVTLKWTQVRNILECRERVPNTNPRTVSPSNSDCDHRPQWVMPEDIQLGDEPFQQWGAVIGSTSGGWSRDAYTRGVAAANRFSTSGGGVGGIDSIANTMGHLSFAQAEFYYEGPNAGDRKQWLWNMGWTARMRRVRLPESFGGSVAAAGGQVGGGGGGGGFNLGSQIVDRVIIH